MAKKVNIIEINGRRYHADTGVPLDASHQVMDIVRPKNAPTKVAPIHVPAKPQTTKARPVHRVAKSLAKHAPKPSRTLMRHTVKKPEPAKPAVKAQGSTDSLLPKPAHSLHTKASVHSLNPERLKHAKAINKSPAIQRFAQSTFEPQPVAHAEAHKPPVHASAPAPAHIAAVATPASRPASPLDIFEQALQKATSHEQLPVKPAKASKRRKLHFVPKNSLRIASASLAVLLLAGFITYQNANTLELYHASAKAGFTATLPASVPSGYHVGGFTYSAGSVAVNFHSNSDDRSFAITEQPSLWDSEILRAKVVASASSDYQTVTVNGTNVFVYDKTATWVNRGIWYSVTNNGGLSPRQVNDIVGSL